MYKLPAVFLSHGGGPCFFMDSYGDPILSQMDSNSDAAEWYKRLAYQLKTTNPPNTAADAHLWRKPKAILVISAHWETENSVYVTAQTDYKSLLYDYDGFPEHTYYLKYPAKGDPQLTEQIIKMLTEADVSVAADYERNFDHGVFVPLLLMYPEADIPVVQLSINANLDPKLHLHIGRALYPLREQGVLIIGSGQITHDMSFTLTQEKADAFIHVLADTLVNKTASERLNTLLNWQTLPFAKEVHPREEHLVPLFVVAGAARGDRGYLLNNHMAGSLALHSFAFL